MFFAGWLGDKITLRLAKRRNGTHIPEDSLVSLIFPTIVCAIGIAVYAISANNPEKYSSWGIIMGEYLRSLQSGVDWDLYGDMCMDRWAIC
jgi:hypothetical protein